MRCRAIQFQCAVCLVLPFAAAAQSVAAADDGRVAYWGFEQQSQLIGSPKGNATFGESGPRPDEFPDFATGNLALRLADTGARIEIPDEGAESRFDFKNGDAISLEAWARLDRAGNNTAWYIIGKGRTHNPGFPQENQNWSMRIATSNGVAQLSFLFATAAEAGDVSWHRWTSKLRFATDSGWHHVALTYRFGKPKTMRGWIDGIPTDGVWDLGGETTKAPVVDDDAVWIGTSMGGSRGNSFQGWLDEISLHRVLFDDETVAKRFHRVGGPRVISPAPLTMPELGAISAGTVLVTFSEGMPAHDRWLGSGDELREVTRWQSDAFLLPRIPRRYDEWGIRKGWAKPVLVRMAADVQFPPGKQKVLLRVRALSRLWIDGRLVATGEPITKDPPNGEEPMSALNVPPLPGLRVAGYHQQEIFADYDAGETGGEHRVVLEMVVGGSKLRAETGEILVAVMTEDRSTYDVLRPLGREVLPLTDEALDPVIERYETSMAAHDDKTRRSAAASVSDFWNERHQYARTWLADNPPPSVPLKKAGASANPIDAFLEDRIDRAIGSASSVDADVARHFHGDVLPLLREHCFRCHGDKAKGGLRLDSLTASLRGGESGNPAVKPGDPDGSELIARIVHQNEDERMPPSGAPLSKAEVSILREWIRSGAKWPEQPVDPEQIAIADRSSDEVFLRRIYLDLLGVPPSLVEAESFLADSSERKRDRLIDKLLADERRADHEMSEWLDILAENPTLLNHSQGSTGPFRFFLHDALRDNKPIDRMVTELLMMRGGQHEGGSAGFAMAAENDAPYAAKGHIVAAAFLGVDLQCARCHDAPYHSATQRDLFSLAAMLQRKPASAPASSQVPSGFFAEKNGEALIKVTLKPDEPVTPEWTFEEETAVSDGAHIDRLMMDPKDSRERLAALITGPGNRRFPRVIVNRLWKRLMGAGFVEPVHDWEHARPSHPLLLEWLAHRLVADGYDLREVTRLIVTSEAYQRVPAGRNLDAPPSRRFFNAPDRRRLTAEQIVDSLHVATGVEMDVEEMTFVHDGKRALSNRQTLGKPKRSWMLASLNNERDRPSLALPKAQAVADVLQSFGWSGSRQMPIFEREREPNVLQPGALANGILVSNLTRAARGSELADLAVKTESPEKLVNALFLRFLARRPTSDEFRIFSDELAIGFENRLLEKDANKEPKALTRLRQVTWFNHMQPEANLIQIEIERRVRAGPPPDPRLNPEWREVYEDLIWSLVNDSEFVWAP